MKIGILGGTFDPIHNTHISMAREALSQLNLDKVFLIPSFCPPHKNSSLITNECHRVNMVKLAVAGLENISYSDFEIKHHLSYTADTYCFKREASNGWTVFYNRWRFYFNLYKLVSSRNYIGESQSCGCKKKWHNFICCWR